MNVYQPVSLQHALQRDFLTIVRQSTLIQKDNNRGSGKLQLSLTDFARQLGWPEDRITVLDARGESGSRGSRDIFKDALRRVRGGTVGAVAFARSDRLGRTALESGEFLDAAAKNQTLIITEGRIYNPASASDKLILGLLNQFAEYENDARTMWMMATRFALAKDGGYRIVLPTGLIAASPEDPEFVKRLDDAGLSEWLNDLQDHKAVSHRNGHRYYVLPYPDREVFESCRMRMECMLSTASLDAVTEMVLTDPAYPRPGLIPATRAIRRYHSDIVVNWIDVNHPNGRSVMRGWFKSPAVYGIYSFRSPKLAKKSGDPDSDRFRVRIENAFPAFAAPEDRKVVLRILDQDKKIWRTGSYDGPRRHMLEVLRCAQVRSPTRYDGIPLPESTPGPCRYLLSAWYQPDGTWGYYSHGCRFVGHKTQHVKGGPIDRVVEEVLLTVFDPDRLAGAMRRLEVEDNSAKVRLKALYREQAEVEKQAQAIKQVILQAEIDGAAGRAIMWNQELDALLSRRRQVERQIDGAQAEVADFVTLVTADRDRILSLGSDLQTLIPLLREHDPAQLRALVATMVETIYFHRISTYACRIEIVFPGGAVIDRSFVTRGMFVTRASAEYAAGRLDEGASPAEIAEELNRAKPKNHVKPWDEDRVRTAPYLLKHKPLDELRSGQHQSISMIAGRAGVPTDDAFIPAMHGHLGPGYYEDGDLWIRPHDDELHRAVPSIARYDVAKRMGWPLDDVVTRAEASKSTGLSRPRVVSRAKRRSGLGQDESGRHWVRLSDFAGS
jgi:DNA invertase Pin-like site-specific DNA recombinase